MDPGSDLLSPNLRPTPPSAQSVSLHTQPINVVVYDQLGAISICRGFVDAQLEDASAGRNLASKGIADNATPEGRAVHRRVVIRRTDCAPAN